jgi:hypothetical protein
VFATKLNCQKLKPKNIAFSLGVTPEPISDNGNMPSSVCVEERSQLEVVNSAPSDEHGFTAIAFASLARAVAYLLPIMKRIRAEWRT